MALWEKTLGWSSGNGIKIRTSNQKFHSIRERRFALVDAVGGLSGELRSQIDLSDVEHLWGVSAGADELVGNGHADLLVAQAIVVA